MRQLWSRGPLLVVVGVVALIAGAWLGLSRGDAPQEGPSPRTRSAPTADLGEVLDFVPGCTIDSCQMLARRDGFRFDGKQASLIQAASASCDAVGLHLVTPREVLWSQPIPGLCTDPIGGIEVDRTGNAFLTIPTGPEEFTALVLRIRGEDVDDFDSFRGRFAGGEGTGARDLDGDGVREIVVVGGSDRDGSTVYRWNGRAYHA